MNYDPFSKIHAQRQPIHQGRIAWNGTDVISKFLEEKLWDITPTNGFSSDFPFSEAVS